MKILMIIRELHYSGAPKVFLWLAKSLSNRGHAVIIYTFGRESNIEIPKNVEYIAEDLSGYNTLLKILHIRRKIRSINANVSISFLLDANVFNILSCINFRTKSVVCERNDPFKPGYYKLKILKPIFSLADSAVFQLPRVANYYDNIKRNTTIIPNPVFNIDKGGVNEFSKRDNTIVALGRLDNFQKRFDVLLHAFKIFVKDHPEYRLIIYGDGPDESFLRKMADDLGMMGMVRFAGKTETPLASIKTAKIFVLSSDFEGIPNSLIEAMALGLPCVSTDCSPGGASFLIENGINGLIVERGNFQKLASAISTLVSDPHLADRIGNNARDVCKKFSEESVIEMWDAFLNNINAYNK